MTNFLDYPLTFRWAKLLVLNMISKVPRGQIKKAMNFALWFDIHLFKPKYGSIRSQAPDSFCIPRVPLRIAHAPLEDCIWKWSLLEEKKVVLLWFWICWWSPWKKWKTGKDDEWKNNDFKVGCCINNDFPYTDKRLLVDRTKVGWLRNI